MRKPKTKEAQEFIRYFEGLYMMCKLEEKLPMLRVKDEHSKKSSKIYYDLEFKPALLSKSVELEIREDSDGSFDYITLSFYSHKSITKIAKKLRKIGVYVYKFTPHGGCSFNITTVEQFKQILSWYEIDLEEN